MSLIAKYRAHVYLCSLHCLWCVTSGISVILHFYLEVEKEYCLLPFSQDEGIALMLKEVMYPDNNAAACHGYSKGEWAKLGTGRLSQ